MSREIIEIARTTIFNVSLNIEENELPRFPFRIGNEDLSYRLRNLPASSLSMKSRAAFAPVHTDSREESCMGVGALGGA